MAQTANLHPCLKCGACCASFRVAFYWMEAEKGCGFEVPVHLTEDLDLQTRCMKGTASKHQPRCIALKGKIGVLAGCTNYEHRPTPCRRFKASYEDGTQNIRCDEARKKHGLPPLNKNDFHDHPFQEKDAEAFTDF